MNEAPRSEMSEVRKRIVNTYGMWGPLRATKFMIGELLMWFLDHVGTFVVWAFFPRDDFDTKYGVSTVEQVEPSEAGITDDTARANAVLYTATFEPVMRHILRHVTSEIDPTAFTFVDLGCGKGRALMIAAQLPFKEIIGVEISPLHAETARRNIARYLSTANGVQCKSVRVSCVNALDFEFPDSDLLVYMFRPFLESVVSGVAANLRRFQELTGHRVFLAYLCPIEETALERMAGFVKRTEYETINPNFSWSLWESRL